MEVLGNRCFRYSTKEKYEDEMKRMIVEMHGPTSCRSGSIEIDVLSDAYDDLVEEYLEFCSG